MLVTLTGLSVRADEVVWTFDKTPGDPARTVYVKKADADKYLPDGWVHLAGDYNYVIDVANGEDGVQALGSTLSWSVSSESVLAFPVKAGKLSLNLKIHPNYGQMEVALYKVTKDGDTYTVGDQICDDVYAGPTISQDKFNWVDFDVTEDGYIGFSIANNGLVLSVKNTYEGAETPPAGGEVTDSWTFDKTPVASGTPYLKKADADKYLPDGWIHLAGDWDYIIDPANGENGVQALGSKVAWNPSASRVLAFPVKAGKLSMNLKLNRSYDQAEVIIYKVNKDGDTYTVGEQLYDKTFTEPELSKDSYNWVDFDIAEDGYVGFCIAHNAYLLEVKNTYEGAVTPPAGEVTDSWMFDKTPVTRETYLNSSNWTSYLPDGWFYIGGSYLIDPVNGEDGHQVLGSKVGRQPSTSKVIALPVKAGKLSMNLKLGRFYYDSEVLIYKVNKDGDTYTVGEQLYDKTYTDSELSGSSFTWVDFDIAEDGYIGFCLANNEYLLEVRNTYEAAAGPTYSVSGTVYDNDLNPVEGAKVSLGSNTTVSDANGAWTLTEVPVGVHIITVAKDGYVSNSVQVNVVENDLSMTNVIINPIVSTLKGHLMDEIDFSITVYGKLTFSDADGKVYATAETSAENPDYEVVFKGAVPESFKVDIEAKYYKPISYNWSPSVGQEYTRNFVVSRRALAVSVKPVNADGAPVSGAKVTMSVKDNPDETVTLGESGAGNYVASRFYAHVAADREYIVTVEHPDYQAYTSEPVVFDGEDKTIEPVLTALAPTVFKGVVKSSLDEEPLADATVSISLPDTPTALVTVTTGPDGTYSLSLDGALEAAYVLSISADYFEPAIIDITEPERGKEYTNDAILKAVMLSFTARVENEAGEAIADAVLSFNGSDIEAADGVYTAEVPAFGSFWNEYAVKVSATGYESQEENIIFSGMPVEKVYTLKEIMLTYTATVVNEAGDAIEGAVVTFDGTELTAADGAYSTKVSYNDAADKTFAVEVSAKGYKTQTVEVSFDGKDVTATYTLEQAMLTFTAIVADDEYEPMEGATATMTDGENTWTLNEDGPGMYSISLPALEADGKTYTVTISKEGYKTTEPYTFTFEGEDHSQAFYMDKDESGIANIGAAADGILRVYDINGCRINVESVKELPAGFYIINGVKTAIR